jgi:CHAD domain-containing protein
VDEFKPILREVKALADALGARRDPDVLLDQLAKLESTLPKANVPGVEAFAAPVHDEQARGNEILAAALDHAERTGLRRRLAVLASRAVAPEPEPEPQEVLVEAVVVEEPAADEAVVAEAVVAEAAAAADPVTTVAPTAVPFNGSDPSGNGAGA